MISDEQLKKDFDIFIEIITEYKEINNLDDIRTLFSKLRRLLLEYSEENI